MAVLGHSTVLLVDSVARAVVSYRAALGFDVEPYDALPEHYAYATRGSCSIHFARFEGAEVRPNSVAAPPDMFDVYVHVDDLATLYEELLVRGAEIVHGPVDQAYGLREFRVRDPHGYILAFGETP